MNESRYNICGVPITKQHALRIAEQCYKINVNYPRGGYHAEQDRRDIEESRFLVYDIKRDIDSEYIGFITGGDNG